MVGKRRASSPILERPGIKKATRTTFSTRSGREIRQTSRPVGFVDSSNIGDDDRSDHGDEVTTSTDGEALIVRQHDRRAPLSSSTAPLAIRAQGKVQEKEEVEEDPQITQKISLGTTLELFMSGKKSELAAFATSGLSISILAKKHFERGPGQLLTIAPSHTDKENHLGMPRRRTTIDPPQDRRPEVKVTNAELKAAGLIGSLPPELRNQIYMYLHVVDLPIDLAVDHHKMSLSANFLKTCKLIHNEGCSILYYENHFIINRRQEKHGDYWTPGYKWQEIGYKAVYQWLTRMGGVNIGWLRSVTLKCMDAQQSKNSPLRTKESRCFWNDPYLVAVIKLLAQHGRLGYLELDFEGHDKFEESEKTAPFFGQLLRVETDQLKIIRDGCSYWQLHTQEISDICFQYMVREHKVSAKRFDMVKRKNGDPVSFNPEHDHYM